LVIVNVKIVSKVEVVTTYIHSIHVDQTLYCGV